MRRVVALCVVVSGLVAASCSSPAAPPGAVQILTAALPRPIIGVAYSHQLSSSGGTGLVSWTVVDGALPQGLTLSAGGLLSGTPSGAAEAVVVKAADSVSADTKLLVVTPVRSNPTLGPSTGALLPDGEALFVSMRPLSCTSDVCAGPTVRYGADGETSIVSDASVDNLDDHLGTDSWVGVGGTRAVTRLDAVPAPISLIDADTGARISIPGALLASSLKQRSFSPNGEYLMIRGAISVSDHHDAVRVYRTSDWQLVRWIALVDPISSIGNVVWSPESTELIAMPDFSSPVVYGIASPSSDRHLDATITATNCAPGPLSWSATGRVLFNCLGSLVSMSAVDGSDVRTVAPVYCEGIEPPIPYPCYSAGVFGAAFSPDGESVVFQRLQHFAAETVISQIVVAPDQANAPVTVLMSTEYPAFAGMINWQ
ncbi:MAG TPA: putative Ig domain-containing protein [Microthrixaceae bacterium]|nr:putative Ig domain-containing protein [Microthrixaceae bacterium]